MSIPETLRLLDPIRQRLVLRKLVHGNPRRQELRQERHSRPRSIAEGFHEGPELHMLDAPGIPEALHQRSLLLNVAQIRRLSNRQGQRSEKKLIQG